MRASRAKVAGLQDTAITVGAAEVASSRACASAPCRGGSNTTASKALSSLAANGCKVALLRRHRLEPRSCRRRAPQGCDCVGIAVDRADAGALGQTKGEWPDAAEQVSDCARVPAIFHDQLREDRLACTRRLQERSWRKCDLGAADRKHGGACAGREVRRAG